MTPLLQADQLRTLADAAREKAAALAQEAQSLRAQAALFETLAEQVLKPRPAPALAAPARLRTARRA